LIVPCGITDKRATSLERTLGRSVDSRDAAALLVKHFGEVFDRRITKLSREEFEAILSGDANYNAASKAAEHVHG
jgi:lipoate-protein ligase B